jgi:hypothetical protein
MSSRKSESVRVRGAKKSKVLLRDISFSPSPGWGAKKRVFDLWALPRVAFAYMGIIAQTPPNGYAAISVSANSLI